MHCLLKWRILGLTFVVCWGSLLTMGMVPVLVYAAAAGLAAATDAVPLPGEPGYTEAPRHHFRGVFENDSISNADRNYSHGTRLDYLYSPSSPRAYGLSLMQTMYTPETHASGRVEGEHPYCGYLALGGAFMTRGVDFGSSTELQIGVTGNASLAGKTQNAVHELLGMEKWRGWTDQIHSEVTFQLSSRQVWRVQGMERELRNDWKTDGAFQLYETAGSFSVAGNVGLFFRIGRNLPPSLSSNNIQPTHFALNPLLKPDYRRDAPSYFLLAGVSGGYVARDLTIDGGLFHDFERSCSRTPWQIEAQLGVGASYHGIDYYCGLLLHSRTYRTQDESSLMGVFSLSWHW